jgi:hypothetical protein
MTLPRPGTAQAILAAQAPGNQPARRPHLGYRKPTYAPISTDSPCTMNIGR